LRRCTRRYTAVAAPLAKSAVFHHAVESGQFHFTRQTLTAKSAAGKEKAEMD